MARLTTPDSMILVVVGPGTPTDPVQRVTPTEAFPPNESQLCAIKNLPILDGEDQTKRNLTAIGNATNDRVVQWGTDEATGSRCTVQYQSAAGATQGAFLVPETGVYSVQLHLLDVDATRQYSISVGPTVANLVADANMRAADQLDDGLSCGWIGPVDAGSYIWSVTDGTALPTFGRITILRLR